VAWRSREVSRVWWPFLFPIAEHRCGEHREPSCGRVTSYNLRSNLDYPFVLVSSCRGGALRRVVRRPRNNAASKGSHSDSARRGDGVATLGGRVCRFFASWGRHRSASLAASKQCALGTLLYGREGRLVRALFNDIGAAKIYRVSRRDRKLGRCCSPFPRRSMDSPRRLYSRSPLWTLEPKRTKGN
jgi:hypothetical protein